MWNAANLEEPRTSCVPCERPLCCLLCFRPESAVLCTLWLTSSLSRTTLRPGTRIDTRTCHRPVFSSSTATLQASRSRPVSLEHDAKPRRCPRQALRTRGKPSMLTSQEADSLTTGPRTRTTEVLQSTSPPCHPFIGLVFRPLGRCTAHEQKLTLSVDEILRDDLLKGDKLLEAIYGHILSLGNILYLCFGVPERSSR